MHQRLRFVCWSASITLGLLSASCSDPAAEDTEPGAIRGKLKSGTADYIEEGRSERVYSLQRKDGTFIPLKFSGALRVPPESEVYVYGQQRGDTLYVDQIKPVPGADQGEIGRQQQGLIDPEVLWPPLKAALISVNPAYTAEMLQARVMRDDFITPVMHVSSYGRWTMEWETHGPFTIPNTCGGNFFDEVGKNTEAAMVAAGIDPTKYDQIQILLPNSHSSCRWTGFGWDGRTPMRTDGKRGMYNRWSYTKSDREGVMVQEIGHNWGLAHVHFCPNTQTPAPGCSGYSEYGSPFTPMSSGNNVYLNAWERIQMNFFSGCNVVTVASSGTYDVGPLTSACNGPQVLRIAADPAADHQRYYYLEYRVPVGIENNTGVLVHYGPDIKAGGWSQCDYGGPDCPEDFLINPMGGTNAQSLLQAGAQWTTPQGVAIRIASLGDTAKFELTFPTEGPAPTCLEGETWNNTAPTCRAGIPPVRDGGAGGSTGMDAAGGGGPTDDAGGPAGTGGTGGTAGQPPPPDDDSGCGCRVPRSSSSGGLSAIALASAIAAIARRRRAHKSN